MTRSCSEVKRPTVSEARRRMECDLTAWTIWNDGAHPEARGVVPAMMQDPCAAAGLTAVRALEARGEIPTREGLTAYLEAHAFPGPGTAADWVGLECSAWPMEQSVIQGARSILRDHQRHQLARAHQDLALALAEPEPDPEREARLRQRVADVESLPDGRPTIDPGACRVDRQWPGLAELLQARADGMSACVPTGLQGLDALLGGGLPAGQTSLLCGPPGSCKSTMALGWALEHARRRHRAIFWSLELPAPICLTRLVCLEAGAPWSKVLAGDCPGDVELTGERVHGLDFHVIEDRGEQGWELVQRLVAGANTGAPPLLVIDYLQLLADGSMLDQRSAVEKASAWVLDLSKATGAAILAISSTSRASYDLASDGRPDLDRMMAMARDSGRLEFDAGAHMGIVPLPTNGEPERHRRAWFGVPKVRLGQRGMLAVEIDGLTGHVIELELEELERKGGANTATLEKEILAVVTLARLRKEPLTSKEGIADRLGPRRRSDVWRAIATLLADGRLRRGKGRAWEVSEGADEEANHAR